MDPSSTLPETGDRLSPPPSVLDESSRDGMRVFLSSYVLFARCEHVLTRSPSVRRPSSPAPQTTVSHISEALDDN
jgi:hypothetical protein